MLADCLRSTYSYRMPKRPILAIRETLIRRVCAFRGSTAHSRLEVAYREAALDEERECEAQEWCEGLIGDGLPEDDFSRPVR